MAYKIVIDTKTDYATKFHREKPPWLCSNLKLAEEKFTKLLLSSE